MTRTDLATGKRDVDFLRATCLCMDCSSNRPTDLRLGNPVENSSTPARDVLLIARD